MVKQDLGYTVNLPGSVGQDIAEGHLMARPIRGLHQKRVLVSSRERPQSRATQEMIRLIQRIIREAIKAETWPGALQPDTQG
jgi:hypothetical protein